MLELYHHGNSVCAQKVRLALAEKNVAGWESRIVALERGEQYAPEFLALNPKGLVPVLVHDGAVITESTIICEYLDDAFPGPRLKPDSALARARMRAWTKRLDDEGHFPHCAAISFTIAFRHIFALRLDTPEKRAAHVAKIKSPLNRDIQSSSLERGLDSPYFASSLRYFDDFVGRMERDLTTAQWLAGDSVSLADIGVAPYVHRLAELQLHRLWLERPRVADWYRRWRARPTWRTAFDDWNTGPWTAVMAEHGGAAATAVQRVLAPV